jgi:hypothetical protein
VPVVGFGNSLEEVGNDGEYSTVLLPSNISIWEALRSSMRPLLVLAIASKRSAMMGPSHISFLIQYLGGYAQLDELVVGFGNGLK